MNGVTSIKLLKKLKEKQKKLEEKRVLLELLHQ